MEQYQTSFFMIKADDFGQNRNFDNWKRLLNLCALYNVVPSIGVVAEPLDTYPREILDLMKAMRAAGLIEIWNHSWGHQNFEIMERVAIVADIKKSQDAIEHYLGVRPDLFGFPYNKSNQAAIDCIVEMEEFNGFFCVDPCVSNIPNIKRNSMIEIERSTQDRHPVQFELLQKRYNISKNQTNMFMLQLHPPYWSNRCFEEFERILKFLRSMKFSPLTASEYIDYQAKIQPEYGKAILAQIAEKSHQVLSQRMVANPELTSKLDYHKNMANKIVAKNYEILTSIGFNVSPNIKDVGAKKALDLGCGAGQWLFAYACLEGERKIIGIDIDPDLTNICNEVIAQFPILKQRVEVRTGDARKLDIPSNSIDHVIFNNAYNYIDHEKVFAEIARVLRNSRFAFIGVQRRSFILNEIAEAHNNNEIAQLQRKARQLLIFEALSAGLFISGGFSHYESDDEIARAIALSGIRGVVRDFDYENMLGVDDGDSLYGGYLVAKTSFSERFATQYFASGEFSQASLDELWQIGLRERFVEICIRLPNFLSNAHNLWRALWWSGQSDDLSKHEKLINLAGNQQFVAQMQLAINAMLAKNFSVVQEFFKSQNVAHIPAFQIMSFMLEFYLQPNAQNLQAVISELSTEQMQACENYKLAFADCDFGS